MTILKAFIILYLFLVLGFLSVIWIPLYLVFTPIDMLATEVHKYLVKLHNE